MSPAERLKVSEEALAALCARYQVRELAVFGSAARGETGPDSDVDLLVLFRDRGGRSRVDSRPLRAALPRGGIAAGHDPSRRQARACRMTPSS